MEKNNFEKNFLEKNVEKGNNVTIHAIFGRHGEKAHNPDNPETGLTDKGREESFGFGKSLETKDFIKSYTSKTARTKETAELVKQGSDTERKGITRGRRELAFVYDPQGNFLKKVMQIKKEVLGDEYNSLSEEKKKKKLYEATSKQVDYYLSFGDKRPDPNTYSPVETASQIAELVDQYIKMSSKLKSNSNVDLFNATHDFNLATFLKEVIIREVNGVKKSGFESIEDIGGPTDFNESFEVVIERKSTKDVSIKLLFRDQEYNIDLNRIGELVNIAKNLKDKKDDRQVD